MRVSLCNERDFEKITSKLTRRDKTAEKSMKQFGKRAVDDNAAQENSAMVKTLISWFIFHKITEKVILTLLLLLEMCFENVNKI